MAVYFITGMLGAGKTIAGISKIQEYLFAGRKVATNLDIFPENLVGKNNKVSITRLPDKPRPKDLYDLGTGDGNHWEDNDTYNESKFGALVFDECATWLNTRDFRDKERPEFIEYLLHSRKYRWDIYFFVQDLKAIDGQILRALCEHMVYVKRFDRVTIPIFTSLVSILSLGFIKLRLPKIHLAIVHYGQSDRSMIVDRWWSYGKSLYNAYRTGQVFRDDVIYKNNEMIDMRASYCLLSAWHLKGRYELTFMQKFYKLLGFTPRAHASKKRRVAYKCTKLIKTISTGEKPDRGITISWA